MKNSIKTIFIIGGMILTNLTSNSQVSYVGTSGGSSADFVGWNNNSGNTFDLTIKHQLAYNINFLTNNNQQMTILGASVSGVGQEGNVGIGTAAPESKLYVLNGVTGPTGPLTDFNNAYTSLNGTPAATGVTGSDVSVIVTSSGSTASQNIGAIAIANDENAVFNVGLFSMAKGGPTGPSGSTGCTGVTGDNTNVGIWGRGVWSGPNCTTTCLGVIGEIKGRGCGVVGCVNLDESAVLPTTVQIFTLLSI